LGVPKQSFWSRLKTTLASLKNKATREYEELPRTKEFAPLRFDLLRLSKAKGVAGDRAIRALQGITIQMTRNDYDLFSRKVILEDLKSVADEQKALPFGFTEDIVNQELDRVNEAIVDNPVISDALEKRTKLWDAIKSDYIQSMNAIGFDVSDRLKRENYFRHQVLEHVNAKGLFGIGKKLRTPAYRGFLKQRLGSKLAINTDYVQAEYEVLAQMLYDIEVARTIANVDKNYNILDELKAKAKEQNVHWESIIPEGYTTWQPREGNVFYMADSVPGKIAKELFSKQMTLGEFGKIEISAEDLRQVLAVGGKRRQFVLKNEIAETLDNLTAKKAYNFISEGSRRILRAWKRWSLISPRRWFKFNFRNVSGDADAAYVGNPSTFKKVPRAMKELYDVYAGDKAMSQDLKDWFERGGMQSNLQVQEMGELNRLDIFKKLQKEGKDLTQIPIRTWKTYWRAARLSTDFRESVLRYAAYLDYVEQMKADPNGKPKNFGASMREEIMALEDIRDRGFWLSNDLLGAYDRVGVMGQALREHLYPFWSWKEVNFKRYIRFARNAAEDHKLASAVGRKAIVGVTRSPFVAYRVGKFLIKATAFWAMLQAWNHLRFPDEEKELPEGIRGRPHIIFGRDKDGKILYFSRIGALGDFLEWFGLDTAPHYVDVWLKGKMTLREIAKDMAKSPVNQIVGGATPFAKVPAEVITRRTLWPDVFEPGTVRDRGYHIARSLGLENEYKAVAGLPSHPYPKSISQFAIYKVDPLQAAYRDVLEEKRRFMKRIGRYGEGFWFTPRGNAAYNFKLALRYQDRKAAEKYLGEYFRLGGTSQGLKQSLLALNPLYGMNKTVAAAFVASLHKEDQEKLMMALRFWAQSLMGPEKKE